MNKQPNPIKVLALTIVCTILSPILMAQSKQPNSAASRNPAATVEGKILWQYNTDG